jgi:hypothetical protein
MRTPLIIIGNESPEIKIKKWFVIVIIMIITISSWFTVPQSRPSPTFTNPEKEQIISIALETPEGREALAEALIDGLNKERSE